MSDIKYTVKQEKGRKIVLVKGFMTVHDLIHICDIEFPGIQMYNIDVHHRKKIGKSYTEIHVKRTKLKESSK